MDELVEGVDQEAAARLLLAHLGAAMIATGQPAHEIEEELVELIRPRSARLVLFLPAFWLLVPGSLGLVGVTTLVADPGRAIETGFDVVSVICAIALGLLVESSGGLALRSRLRPAPTTS